MHPRSPSDPFQRYQTEVARYLKTQDMSHVEGLGGREAEVIPLARGEYNLNYLVTTATTKLVFRINMGTQIGRDDQIVYEFNTLRLLEKSGVTPKPYHVDDSREIIDRGIGIMEFLEGAHLDYNLDLLGAARTFAAIHSLEITDRHNHLIREDRPLTLIFKECARLVDDYCNSPLADDSISSYLKEVLDWADTARKKESYFHRAPFFCIVNSEVNSNNFIVNRKRRTTHLIDWEMARWGDPSTDLCHFCSALTTLWKSDYRMTATDRREFIKQYKNHIGCPHLRDSLEDRMKLKDPFVYLRGISWSAMAWAAYQTGFAGIRNETTWQKLQEYMQLDFIKSLFDPFISSPS
ncbi:phosphotransferase family protein [Desulforhopalus singaporensis]|uniref:Phosphotransferase enzyme family protein n=1 Tax=Desulforhopalus singaporensis TaxID=91360 RepID=A0A1H0SWD9_9BACT|nr:aminoglycoside phosphotransferase family protein [Desulforhopalus singaporensis]SDP46097.1 Phosphotransferase enzyme family protein [Desulforhopalus singaporensis]